MFKINNIFKPNDTLKQSINFSAIEQSNKNMQRIRNQIAQQNFEKTERDKQMLEYVKQSAKTAEDMYEYTRWVQIESARETDTARTIAGISLLVSVISIMVSIIIAAVD